jgi:hypothetical protein
LRFELLEGDRAEVHIEIDMGYRESEAPESEGEHLFVCLLLQSADVGGGVEIDYGEYTGPTRSELIRSWGYTVSEWDDANSGRS